MSALNLIKLGTKIIGLLPMVISLFTEMNLLVFQIKKFHKELIMILKLIFFKLGVVFCVCVYILISSFNFQKWKGRKNER